LIPDSIINECLEYLKNNVFFIGLNPDDGSLWVCPGARRGNSVYANRRTEVVSDCLSQFDFDSKRCLWLTCTQKINYSSLESMEKSYLDLRDQIPKFTRQVKKLGVVKYMYVIEAHKRGGAHVHLVLQFDRCLPFHADKKDSSILRLSDESLRDSLKSAWPLGHCDVQVVWSVKIASYLVKEVCKNSSIEKALQRLKAGKPAKNDANRIWGFYFLVLRIKNMRSWGTSRNVKRGRLDSNMNNSTGEENIARIEESVVVMLNKNITKKDWFQPITGVVPPGSVMERELLKILEPIIARRKEIISMAELASTA